MAIVENEAETVKTVYRMFFVKGKTPNLKEEDIMKHIRYYTVG